MDNIAKRLKKLRKQIGLKQKEIAEKLNITAGGYSNYERNFSLPSYEKLVQLANIYHTTLQYIITGEQDTQCYDEKNFCPFPQRLRELREKRNMTQQQVADYLGIRKVTYQHYEYGAYEPKLDKLLQLADLFDVTLDELLGRNRK